MTAEQEARDMLEKMGVPDAQKYCSGDLVWLANLIAERDELKKRCQTQARQLYTVGDIMAKWARGEGQPGNLGRAADQSRESHEG